MEPIIQLITLAYLSGAVHLTAHYDVPFGNRTQSSIHPQARRKMELRTGHSVARSQSLCIPQALRQMHKAGSPGLTYLMSTVRGPWAIACRASISRVAPPRPSAAEFCCGLGHAGRRAGCGHGRTAAVPHRAPTPHRRLSVVGAASPLLHS